MTKTLDGSQCGPSCLHEVLRPALDGVMGPTGSLFPVGAHGESCPSLWGKKRMVTMQQLFSFDFNAVFPQFKRSFKKSWVLPTLRY